MPSPQGRSVPLGRVQISFAASGGQKQRDELSEIAVLLRLECIQKRLDFVRL